MKTDQVYDLGSVEFRDNNDLTKYCRDARTVLRLLSQELAFAGDELRAALSTVAGSRAAMGIDVRMRARIVSAHLLIASDLLRIAVGAVAKCHASFIKHFAPELAEIKQRPGKPSFRIVEPDRKSV